MNLVATIFLVLGSLAVLVNLLAWRQSLTSGRYVSGLPFVGGILLGVGLFLTFWASPYAALGLLPVLLDPWGAAGIFYSFTLERRARKRT
ncbi:MAG: hypothetical protein U0S12_12840 [Fimbriimonadales bacterium]